MATVAETRVVNAAGAAQGIVLVTFPAASTVFTSASEYGCRIPSTASSSCPK